ncbi:MAG: ABC transporter ATP-binding protein [Gammaproteobacteria bacterium]|nr:ABC transporter ATP-binding protein [Gammaproteobacteria bacterium]
MSLALSIRNLTKDYKNGFRALKGLNLEVEEGDFFALLGPNGAGKSTCIGIITTLVRKTSGQVEIFGHDIDKKPQVAKTFIGLVPQEFNFNVFEPVVEIVVNQGGYYGIPREEAYKRAEELLKQLQLWDKRHEMARNLSGGMKRRLMIARALIHQPKLLILDEPTAGVDIEVRRSMWTFLRELNQQGTTIILTTHYLEEAEQLCRNVGIIDKGDLVSNTSVRSLLGQVNTETFVLDIESPLTEVPRLSIGNTRLVDELTLEIDITKGQINQTFVELEKHGITVASLRNKANRLEEMFVDLVNKS